MTVHAAKGLEFDYVFVAGLEEGLFPFTQYEETTQEDLIRSRIEEERRLLYVAVTRARIGLSLWRAKARTFRGRRLALPPSRFLAEIEDMVPTAEQGPRVSEGSPAIPVPRGAGGTVLNVETALTLLDSALPCPGRPPGRP
ncbi:MAG: hypothetical protein MZV70_69520 [Desulfobacterales bacterium]|nr:hypothetical protein [Desulfobacterales bacterium]